MERNDCLIALYCCLDICGHLSGQMLDIKVKVKVKCQVEGHLTSNDLVTFWGYKLSKTDHKSHRDIWGHKEGHGDL